MKILRFISRVSICSFLALLKTTDIFGQTIEWTCAKVAPPYQFEINHIAFHPDGHIFIGGPMGLFRSEDNGNTWVHLESLNSVGHLANAVVSLAIGLNGDIFAGLFIVSGVARSKDNGLSWVLVGGADRYGTYDGIGFVETLLINANGELLAGTYKGLFLYKDGGESWLDLSAGFRYGEKQSPEMLWEKTIKVKALAMSPRGNIVAGTEEDGLFYSANGGIDWTLIGLKNDGFTYLVFGTNESILVSIRSFGLGKFYRSINRGKSWISVLTKNIGTAPASLATNSNGHIFAGTTKGVFRSLNNGTTWSHVGLQSRINAIAIDQNGFIFAAPNNGTICRSLKSTTMLK